MQQRNRRQVGETLSNTEGFGENAERWQLWTFVVTPPRLAELCDRLFCRSVCEHDDSRSR